ncbi:MAG: hypothetical protein ACPGJS_08330 [Flammeovirgaceae bacterium]
MTSPKEQLEALSDIRSMMERSSRFISLSGLSGIFAGLTALVGAYLAYLRLNQYYISEKTLRAGVRLFTANPETIYDLVVIALGVLVVALSFGVYFTTRNAKRKGQKIWDPIAQRLILNLFIPLAAGGIFCLILIYHQMTGLVPAATLIFYGLALINASKYTLRDIWYLGICETILGLIACFYIGYGLIFWAIGFGVLHIIYGTVMYIKYEAKDTKA